jgi:hypothetical protein
MATKQLSKFVEYRTTARQDRPVHLAMPPSHEYDEPLMQSMDNGTEMSSYGNDAARRRLANVSVPAWLRRIKPLESAMENINLECTPIFSVDYSLLYPVL